MKVAWLVVSLWIGGVASGAQPPVVAKIEPSAISVGETARLTITMSGVDLPRVTPPPVPGLEFTAVGQSRRVDSINGRMTSTFSVIYQVTARQAGTYVIASLAQGVPALMLRVDAPGSVQPPAESSAAAADDTILTADGAAFVRLRVAKHQLYVGESVPVEIEVGTRDGVVASLNGLPTLNGDAFTLDKLSSEPDRRTQEVVDGAPFTVFFWHSVLAPIKPGSLSLSLQTPVTVRVQPDDEFDTEKDVLVSSPPVAFRVLGLPSEGRPKDFNGAVGEFEVASELEETRATVGDPLTLRMTVSGRGDFDRINTKMLAEVPHWRTYEPTAKFKSADTTAYRGEKTFEQPIVAMEPGRQTLPGLSFSYFDPSNGRYETARTGPLTVDVAPAPVPTPSAPMPAAAAAATRSIGMLADHSPSRRADSLIPLYLRPTFIAIPALVILGFPAAWFWLLRRERRLREVQGASHDARMLDPARLAAEMDRAIVAGDGPHFFRAARAVLQRLLSDRWGIAIDEVTLAQIDARLGRDCVVRQVFVTADEALYCGRRFSTPELERWKLVIRDLQSAT